MLESQASLHSTPTSIHELCGSCLLSAFMQRTCYVAAGTRRKFYLFCIGDGNCRQRNQVNRANGGTFECPVPQGERFVQRGSNAWTC